MKKRIVLSLLIFFTVPFISFSQNDSSQYIVTHSLLSVDNGLASREVFCGVQDDDGFMWFGTRNGLNRYDGKNFKLFTKQKDSLSENKIIQIVKDNNNHLFLFYGHPGFSRRVMKIEVMDLKTYKIKSVKQTFPDLPFDEKYLYWMANEGPNLCFLIAKPFQFWKLSNGKFELKCEMKTWDDSIAKMEDRVTSNGAYHTSSGWHSIFTRDYSLIFMGNMFTQYFVTPDKVVTGEKNIDAGAFAISPDHEVLYTTISGFSKLKANGDIVRNISSFKPPVSVNHREIYFRLDNQHNLAAYTSKDGLLLYDFSEWKKLLPPSIFKITAGSAFYGIYEDKQQNFWTFTSSGLYKIKIEKNPFEHYFTKAQLKDNSDNQVRAIVADENGNVYANIWDKLYYKNKKDNVLKMAVMDGISYALCRHNNSYFDGSGFLYKYDESKNRFSKNQNQNELTEIWTIDSLSAINLLVGTSNQIYTFNTVTQQLNEVKYSNNLASKAKFTYRFIIRKDKKIWAVAQNGLYLLDEKGERVVDYFSKDNSDKSHQFPFDIIYDAYQDENDILWFATNGEGLYRWDKNKNTFQQFNITAGFPSDILYRIESDNYNNLWISTDNGLVRFNTTDFKTNTYTVANGISHNEFNRISSFKAKDGRLFFGGLDGVNAFYPKDFIGDTISEKTFMHVISFNKFSGEEDKLVDLTSLIQQQNKIDLQPGDKFFNLEFQLLDYNDGKINYAYKIDGIDKDWNYISENSIRISGLPYGDFTLRVKGQGTNGQWSQSELSIPISVFKPFYKTTSFILAIFVVILILIFSFIRLRTKSLTKSKHALERTVGERTEQLKNSLAEKETLLKEIHHRVKNNLQVIVNLLELQQKKNNSLEFQQSFTQAKANVRSISLIHENLYRYDNFSAVDINSFAQELFNQLNIIFNHSKKQIEFICETKSIQLDIDTAVPIGLILNELITNSFKYTFEKTNQMKISIEIKQTEDETFELIYHDNGNGLPIGVDVKTATSTGINLIKDLSRQIGGGLEYKFEHGSWFTIKFLSLKGRKKID